MNTYPFCTDINDEHLEKTVIFDFECEVAVEVIVSGGDMTATVTDALVDGKSMFRGDEITRALGAKVMDLAQTELDAGGLLWDRVRDEEGVEFIGLNANDPDGRWQRVAA